MLSEDILYLSVRELGERIRGGKLSPVELAESFLARSEALGPKLNAYATITRELALQQARAAEKEIASGHYRGPLHGVPYAAKDLVQQLVVLGGLFETEKKMLHLVENVIGLRHEGVDKLLAVVVV